MSSAQVHLDGEVGVIVLDNPPVNSLGFALRRDTAQALDRLERDDAVRAIVLVGGGTLFSGGADVREFGTPKAMQSPNLLALIAQVETCAKPVIAAIQGVCMGGGTELALGCHFRVARADASIALPEIKLGLLPGAGGTQRLPRLVGVQTALDFILSGDPVPAARFRDTALFDEIVDGDVREAAIAFARRVVAEARTRKRVRDLSVEAGDAEAFLQFARNTIVAKSPHLPAPARVVDAIAAAVSKPFDEGLRIEREAFLALMQTPESRALRHAFAAERAASKIADVPADTPVRRIDRVGIVGAGTMGTGIAMNFLTAGIPVTLVETQQAALDRGMANIRGLYETSARKGKLAQDEVERRMARLSPSLALDALADADLVIEAVFEDMAVKQQVFGALDAIAKPGAILASNTSTLDLDHIAAATRRPRDVIGLHFFSPANVMRLLEVVRGKETAPDVLATVMQLAKRIRKAAVVSGVCDGFIGNRMLEQYGRMAGMLVEAGATPQQVDGALERFGLAMGPFRMGDLAGLDIGWAIRKRRYVEKPHLRYPRFADRLCEQGRFGQKTGAGWYRYEAGQRKALPDPVVERMLSEYRNEIGVTPRRIEEPEIVARCIYALVNEGARILEEGIAQRASDIDVVYLMGYGFPAWRGGPMAYADQVGLPEVVRTMRRFAAEPGGDAAFWTPANHLIALADAGGTFNG